MATIYSRPLVPLLKHPDDLEVLTPVHFLGTAPLALFAEPDFTKLNLNRLDRWQRITYYQLISNASSATFQMASTEDRRSNR